MLWRIAAGVAILFGTITGTVDLALAAGGDRPMDARLHQLAISAALALAMGATGGRVAEVVRGATRGRQEEYEAGYRDGWRAKRDEGGVVPLSPRAGR
jgi:hypothetical protein